MSIEIIQKRLSRISEKGLLRKTRMTDSVATHPVVDGKLSLLLCSNNYLGLADHPSLKEAASEAALKYGTSSGASRLVSGTQALHEELEHAVAEWKGAASALLFNSGYAANTGVIQAVAGRGDIVFSDRLNHASIIDGILMSGARLVRYPHNDAKALEELLGKHPSEHLRLIVTDSVFSMDGDIAPLQELAAIASRHNALLMVDDAHGGGVLGNRGRGAAELSGISGKVDLLVGTFGKALGSFGSYVVCNKIMKNYLINTSRSFIYSTSLPPAVISASITAIKIVQSDEGDYLRRKLSDNVALFRSNLIDNGVRLPAGITPIVPIHVGPPQLAMELSGRLFKDGFFLQAIRPPTVPPGTSRLRCTLMATHSQDDLVNAATVITNHARDMGII